MERNYLLLTPGPLSTSESVRHAMLQDWCTWDKDYNEGIVTPLRHDLLAIAGLDEADYTTVLLQGSGTYCVEATIGATVRPEDKLLILANGAYGKRMAQIADYYKLNYVLVSLGETELVTGEVARKALEANPGVTHLSMVHSETTTGLLNPIEEVAEVIRGRGITFIVDAMSSFAGVPIDIKGLGMIFWSAVLTNVSRACRASALLSPRKIRCWPRKAMPARSPWIFMRNGKRWRKDMANGVSPRRRT